MSTRRRLCSRHQHHPEDVVNERAYWAERTARRRSEWADRRQRKAVANEQCDIVSAGGRSFFTSDDERWDDIWLLTSDNTDESDDGDGSDLK